MKRELPWVLYVVILLIALVPVLYTESEVSVIVAAVEAVVVRRLRLVLGLAAG